MPNQIAVGSSTGSENHTAGSFKPPGIPSNLPRTVNGRNTSDNLRHVSVIKISGVTKIQLNQDFVCLFVFVWLFILFCILLDAFFYLILYCGMEFLCHMVNIGTTFDK